MDPNCDNYLFDGWYHDKTFTSRVVPTDTITKDLYVYANWVPTLDVFRYYGTQMYDVLDLDDINSNNVHVDDNTIYVRLATVTGEIISSGAPIPGNGGRIQVGTTSSTITASSISNCIVNSYEKIITKPKCPISSVGASVGILDKIEIGLDFGIDLGDTTTRTLNQYISQDSQFNGNGLSYNVTYHLESVNGMWYRVAHTTVYQIIQYIEVTDWSDPSNPKFSTGYMTMMEPLVIQLQCSDNPSFKDTVEKECYDLDSETIINLIGEYIVGSSRSDMNKVIFHSELGDDSVRYKYVEDGKTISDDPSEFFINDGYWVVGWSDVPTDSKVFSRESIINLDSPIYEDKDLYAIWLPDRLKEENFTLICNQEELSEINDDLGGDYVLATDITLTGAWTPIADEKEEYFFGTLDGAGHSISNLKITGKFTSNYYKDLGTDGNDFTYIGLFAKVGSKAEISYMSFVDFLISPSSDKGWISAGCVAGLSRGGLFHDIVLDSGDVISKTADTIDTATKEAFGGLIGVAQDMTVIQDCIVREGTSVKASGYYTYAGGLVGSLEHNGVTISCCINEADVTGSGSKDVGVGGITGAMKHDGSLIEFCYNLGVIRGQPNSEKCSEGPHVGHMIGYDYIEGKSGDINFCYGLIDHLYKKGKLVDNGMVGYGKVNTDSNNHREYASRFIVTTWEDNDHMPSTDLRWDGKNGFYLQWEADE